MEFKTVACTGKNDSGKRVDRIIRLLLPDISLGTIYREIRKGRIRINFLKTLPENRVDTGDTVDLHISLLPGLFLNTGADVFDKKIDLKKTAMPEIIFENADIIAVNKPRGIAVHGGTENLLNLETIIRFYLKDKTEKSISFNPGPLNRLDKNTSGIVFFGKTADGARIFTSLLKKRKIKKSYIGITDNIIIKNETWENSLVHNTDTMRSEETDLPEGKTASTEVFPLYSGNGKTAAVFKIKTGRYHQIRKQASLNRYPLTGDIKYGGDKTLSSYFLHCFAVEAEESMAEIAGFSRITARPAEDFHKAAEKLFGYRAVVEIRNKISLLM